MATFNSPDAFKEHKQYVVLLKKALLQVKGETQKKFLYFKQYVFGAKKLPLVLVDYDLGCPAALAKAGVKPTDEGMVSLTPQDELNFEPKKGNFKRIRLRKYFATMGGGIKPVFVPAGETDDEAEGEEQSAEEITSSTGSGDRVQAGADPSKLAAEALSKFTARLKALQPDLLKAMAAGGPAAPQFKTKVAEGGALANKKDFAAANRILDDLETLLKEASAGGAKTATSPSPAKLQDFRKKWAAAKQSWQSASDDVDAQITRLQQALRKSGDNELKEIAEFGLNGVTGNFKVPLMTAVREVDGAGGENLASISTKMRNLISGFRKHIGSNDRVEACDENPFSVEVSIRKTIGEGLAKLDEALASIAA